MFPQGIAKGDGVIANECSGKRFGTGPVKGIVQKKNAVFTLQRCVYQVIILDKTADIDGFVCLFKRRGSFSSSLFF